MTTNRHAHLSRPPRMASTTLLWLSLVALLCPAIPAQAFRQASELPPATSQLERQTLMNELATIRQRWPGMTHQEQQEAGQLYLPNPVGDNQKANIGLAKVEQSTTVSGATIIKTPHFRVIFGSSYAGYINKGGTAFSLGLWTDGDGDGLPKFIELLVGGDPTVSEGKESFATNSSGILETVWGKEINTMGFPAPPGTDEAYLDIYIANTGVKNPAVDFNNGYKGITLPSTVYGVTSTYQNGQPYLILSQDVASSILQVTAAHEFFHAVQIGYVDYNTLLDNSTVNWLAESSATWMEDKVYPLVNDYVNYVWQLTDSPQWSLFDPDLVYSAVLFQKYLAEGYHGADDPEGGEVIKSLWAGLAASGGDVVTSLEGFLATQTVNPHHSLAEAYADFAVKNLDLAANYLDGKLFSPVTLSKLVTIDSNFTPSAIGTVAGGVYAPSFYGSTYIKVSIKDGLENSLVNRLRLGFVGNTLPQWYLQLVPIAADGTLGRTISVNLGKESEGHIAKEDNGLYTSAYLVVSALPSPGQALDVFTAYDYAYLVDAYLATRLASGWNLQHVPASGLQTYGEGISHILSAWKWNGGNNANWEVTFPTADPLAVEAYVQAKGFGKLTTINDDDGVWLNTDSPGLEEAAADTVSPQALIVDAGWNLLASRVPARVSVDTLAAGQGPLTFWKWQSATGTWAFYSSEMAAQQTLADYIAGKGFGRLSSISYGDGFWVNSPQPTVLTLQETAP